MHHRILGVDVSAIGSFMMLNRVAAAGFFSAQALLATMCMVFYREAMLAPLASLVSMFFCSPGREENGTCSQTTSLPGFSTSLTQYGVQV